jgi:preprotein translocase subunit SecD
MRGVFVLALVAACGSSGPVRIDKGIRLEYSLDLDAVKDRGAAVADAVRVIERRIARGRIKATAFARGEHFFIDLAAGDPEDMQRARDLFARVGRFEVKVVDSGTPLMQQHYLVANEDPRAREARIGAQTEHWMTGGEHADWYLTGPDRPTLQTYVRDQSQKFPALAIPDDRQVGYERVEPVSDARAIPYWRTYLLERAARLSNPDIERASPFDDRNTGRPSVRIDLADAPARAFGELTGTIVGKKLAILIDDRVVSAPIIASAIDRGIISFSIDEPKVIAIALGSGPLPAPVRLETMVELDGDKIRYSDADGNMFTAPR